MTDFNSSYQVQEPVTTNSLDRRQRERTGPPTRVPQKNDGSDSPKVR